MKKFVCSLVFLVAMTAHAASYISNKTVLEWDAAGTNRQYVIMYMMGVNDVLDGHLACVPLRTEGKYLYRNVISYIRTADADPEGTAAATITEALMRKWPCKKKVVPM